MKARSQILAKLVLTVLVTTLSPLSFTALSTQSSSEMDKMNAQLFKELTKIKRDLAQGDIQSAKETLAQIKKLYGKFPQYQDLISFAQTKIEEKEGVGTKTRIPQGNVSAQKSSNPVMEPDELDINAFDNAFLNNNTAEAERIFNKYPSTSEDSAKKTDFLEFAANALKILREENVGAQKGAYGQRKRTASGFKTAFDGFFASFKNGLSSQNINLAKESLAKMERYSSNSEADQSSINFVREKINEFEKTNREKPALKDDISDEDIAAFKHAFETDDTAEAERIFNKYPGTSQDSKKKKDFLALAYMELQIMPNAALSNERQKR